MQTTKPRHSRCEVERASAAVGVVQRRVSRLATTIATALLGLASLGSDRHALAEESNAAPAGGGGRRLSFDVFLDERPIGFQRFELSPSEDGLAVETQARFALDLLRVRALDYDHHNRERWRRGCLESIESRTQQNGKSYRVLGRARGERFEVEGQEGPKRLDGCIRTFAYWDREALRAQTRLLNSQTGEHLAVEIRSLGSGMLRIGDRELAVERVAIRGEDLEIDLAYTRESAEWVALDSPLLLGRTLRYRRSATELMPSESPSQSSATAPAPATNANANAD